MDEFKIEKNILEEYYNFQNIKKIIKHDGQNLNSKVFFFQNKKKNYVLKFVKDKNIRTKVEKRCQILITCKEEGLPVQEPIRNISNTFFTNNHYTVTKYYSGLHFDGSKKELFSLSKNLAVLHKKLSNIKIDYNYNPNRELYKLLKNDEAVEIRDKIKEKKTKNVIDKLFLDNFILLQQSFSNVKMNLEYKKRQKQIIHFDLYPENVIFKNHQVYAILDFDTMRKGDVLDDISFASFRFALEKTSNNKEIKQKMKYFFDVYKRFNNKEISINELPNGAMLQILKRISFIIKNYYLHSTPFWESDLKKQLKLLKKIEQIKAIWN